MEALVALARGLTTAVLVTVAVRCVVQQRRGGGQPAKWAALTFGVLSMVVMAARVVPQTGGEVVDLQRKLLAAGLACFPYCLYRFTAAFEEQPSRRIGRLASIVTVGMIAATFLLPDLPARGEPRPASVQLYIFAFLIEWPALSVLAATKLWRGGRAHPTLARRRMRLLSVASLGLAMALIAAGLANTSESDTFTLGVELLVLTSAVLFLAGLVPPNFLRVAWRSRDEQSLHRAVETLVASTSRDEVAATLLPNLTAIAGGQGAALVSDGQVIGLDGVEMHQAQAAARQADGGDPQEGDPYRVDIELRSGRLVVWVSRYTPFFGAEEIEHLHFLGGLLDVALERVRLSESEAQARRALEREKAFSQNLINSNSEGMIAFDRELRYTLWNPAMERITGIPASDVIGQVATERFPQMKASSGEEMLRRALAGEHITDVQRFFEVPGTGAEGWLDVSCAPIEDESGNVVGALMVVRDVTARTQAEDLRSHLAAIVNSTDDAILSKDLDGTIISWNQAAERLYGYTSEEAIGQPVSILIPPERSHEMGDILDGIRRGEPVKYLETVRVTKDGRRIPVSIAVSPIRNSRGEIVAASSTARDITQAKATQEALTAAKEAAERANREKSEFLSRMSHELRTPLNAILGFAQLLGMQELSPQDEESVDHITKAGRHLLELINEVLDISRIETGKLALSLEPVEVDEVVSEALTLVGPLARQREVDIQRNGQTGCGVYANADLQRFKQVTLNLLSNAIKYNHRGGAVTVGCQVHDGRVKVTVSDTGPGIPPEKMERLWEPFDRLGAEQSGVEGTGLGLALSKGLTEAMGGTLHGHSEPGRGSSFCVELPSARAPSEKSDEKEPGTPVTSPSVVAAGTKTVLYIEDNVMNVRLVERLMEVRTDIHLLTAMQGSIGLDLARQHHPHLVLLDLNLPDVPGADVLHRLRSDSATKHIPVAVVSADASKAQRERILDAGAYAYLTKPIDVPEFLRVLDEGLQRSPGAPSEVAAGPPDRPPRVLIVDDDGATRRLLRLSLELEGIEVVGEAEDGVRAVMASEELEPDVVLTDLRLPQINGLEATRRIKNASPATEVVIFTGHDDPAIHEQARLAGSYRCLVKGSTPDAVVAVVNEAWAHKWAENRVGGNGAAENRVAG